MREAIEEVVEALEVRLRTYDETRDPRPIATWICNLIDARLYLEPPGEVEALAKHLADTYSREMYQATKESDQPHMPASWKELCDFVDGDVWRKVARAALGHKDTGLTRGEG